MNPILSKQFHVPDVEARQWSDGRMYLYGSLDTGGDTILTQPYLPGEG